MYINALQKLYISTALTVTFPFSAWFITSKNKKRHNPTKFNYFNCADISFHENRFRLQRYENSYC